MTKLAISLILVSLLTTYNNPCFGDTLTGQVTKTQVRLSQPTYQYNGQASQYAGEVSEGRPQVSVLTPQQAQASQPRYQTEIEHGCQPIGVVGAKIDDYGTVQIIYPISNLGSTGVVPGDQIVAVDGVQVLPGTYATVCRGIPGQYKSLTIARNGQYTTINVLLIDARMLVKYNSEFQQSASMTRFW